MIMPSYTFVTTASAFALRGAVPVFVDVDPRTLNIDETLIEAAITPRTRAVVVVHYAGVACEMDTIVAIAAKHGLMLIEDAAQAIMSSYKGRPLGSLGDLSTFSFHVTKNLTCGEGGALLVGNPDLVDRSYILQEKGTNRHAFFEGRVNKYEWVDLGSSYLLGEIPAAFLEAQLESASELTESRLEAWSTYQEVLRPLEDRGWITLTDIPSYAKHNGHMAYFLLSDEFDRSTLLRELRSQYIEAVFHYIPLHQSPAGKRLGRIGSTMDVTDRCSSQIVRLPIWSGMASSVIEYVGKTLEKSIAGMSAGG